jgi:hypothetical protein
LQLEAASVADQRQLQLQQQQQDRQGPAELLGWLPGLLLQQTGSDGVLLHREVLSVLLCRQVLPAGQHLQE